MHSNVRHTDDENLRWAATDQSALLAGVRFSQTRGIGLDSSWRNKNENCAPMTIIVTTNEESHLLPGKLAIL